MDITLPPTYFQLHGITRLHSQRVRRAEYMHTEFGISVVQAGTVDTLIDRLPGFVDGVSRGAEDGSFWVSSTCA